MNVYSGIGSRETNGDGLVRIFKYATALNKLGYWCRTGAAIGADQKFASASKSRTILYLPWCDYEKGWVNNQILEPHNNQIGCIKPSEGAIQLASQFHPNWKACSNGARKLHGRNAHIILGRDLKSPSKFVLYTAQEVHGEVQGGTGLGIRLAREYNIRYYNLLIEDDVENFYVEQLESK